EGAARHLLANQGFESPRRSTVETRLASRPQGPTDPPFLLFLPEEQGGRGAEQLAGRAERLADRRGRLIGKVASLVEELQQPAPQLVLVRTQIAEQDAHDREIGSAGNESAEIEPLTTQDQDRVGAERDVD